MNVAFLKPSVFAQGPAPSNERQALQMVELCGRTAYKSEEKITESSAQSFVLMLKKHGHLSVLEHSNIALSIEASGGTGVDSSVQSFMDALILSLRSRSSYHRFFLPPDQGSNRFVMAGNFRCWIETLEHWRKHHSPYYGFFSHHLARFYPSLLASDAPSPTDLPFTASLMTEQEQLKFLQSDSHSDLPVFIFKFICDRGITHEVVRHRVLSFTQESTRYVNYQNKGMTLILPEELYPFFDDERGSFVESDHPAVKTWLNRAGLIFQWYQEDVNRGLRPEIARDILPNLLKGELFVSGRWSGWKHFIELRDSRQAHPRIRLLAKEVRQYFDSKGLSLA